MADELVLDRSTLGHSLKPLEREGLISYSVGDDRRSRVIALSVATTIRRTMHEEPWPIIASIW